MFKVAFRSAMSLRDKTKTGSPDYQAYIIILARLFKGHACGVVRLITCMKHSSVKEIYDVAAENID